MELTLSINMFFPQNRLKLSATQSVCKQLHLHSIRVGLSRLLRVVRILQPHTRSHTLSNCTDSCRHLQLYQPQHHT